jgi:hypothetical protein
MCELAHIQFFSFSIDWGLSFAGCYKKRLKAFHFSDFPHEICCLDDREEVDTLSANDE